MKRYLLSFFLMIAFVACAAATTDNVTSDQVSCERVVVRNNTYVDQAIINQNEQTLAKGATFELTIPENSVNSGDITSPIPLEWTGQAKWYIDGKQYFTSEEQILINPFPENQTNIQGIWNFTIYNYDLKRSLYGYGSAWFRGNYYSQSHKIIIDEIGWTKDPTKNGDTPFVLYPLEGSISEKLDEIKWNDGYKFRPLTIPEKWYSGFKVTKNNNKFPHHKSTFFEKSEPHKYILSAEYYEKLRTHPLTREHIKDIQSKIDEKWDGSCFGISATMGLVFEGKLTLGNISSANPTPDKYYDLKEPCVDKKLRDVINCYQLVQDYLPRGEVQIGYIKDPFLENQKAFLKQLIDVSKEYAYKGKVLFLGYSYNKLDWPMKSGHAVLIIGGEHDKDNHQYKLRICDPNNQKKEIYMTIEEDFSQFNINGKGRFKTTGLKIRDSSSFSSFFNINGKEDIKILSNSSNSAYNYIVFSIDDYFQINTSSGYTFNNDKNGFYGTLPIVSTNFVFNDTKSYIRIQTENFDKCSISITSKHINLKVYNNNGFKRIEGDNIENIDLSVSGDMKISGNSFEFKAFSSVDEILNEKESGLGSIYAKGKGEVVIHKGQKTVEATSDNQMSHIETRVYQGVDVATGKIKGKHNSVSVDTTHDISNKNLEDTGMIIFSKAGYAYRGRPIKPYVSVYVGGKSLKKNKDFKVTYENNVEIGTGTLTVTGVGNYSGELSAEFPIIPKKVKMKKVVNRQAGFEVSWKTDGPRDGFEIQYSTNQDFKSVKTKKVEDAESSSAEISGLVVGTEYFVRIRAYKSVDGKTFNSNWSDVKSVLIYPY